MPFALTDFPRHRRPEPPGRSGGGDFYGTVLPDGTSIPVNNSSAPNAGNRIPAQFVDFGRGSAGQNLRQGGANRRPSAATSTPISPHPQHQQQLSISLRIGSHSEKKTASRSCRRACESPAGPGQRRAPLLDAPATPSPTLAAANTEAFGANRWPGAFLHIFNSTTTNDLMAAWAFGSFPFVEPDPSGGLPDHPRLSLRQGLSRPARKISRPTAAPATLLSRISRRLLFSTILRGNTTVRKEAPSRRCADQGLGRAHGENGRLHPEHG